jgi:hypothetical protein
MIVNRPTADELADVRAEIRALKAREQELREVVLHDPEKCRGVSHEVVIRRQKRRVLLRDRLPAHIIQNPVFWEEREAKYVTVRKRQSAARNCGPPEPPPMGRAIRPGDPAGLEEEPAAFSWATEEYAVIEAW